jgi:protein-S-isoprenylcysteine O-methyltransferase Ste14
MPWPHRLTFVTALVVLLTGMAVRWVAIVTLGKLFTVDVAIQPGHTIFDRGIYRHIRHPSYSGLLITFCGMGLAFANWLSLLALMTPVTLAVFYRIRQEERALLDATGPAYAAYCRRTKRLFPGVY